MRTFILFLFMCSCALAQDKTGIAVDPSAQNIAALFTMTNENGRTKNLELMEEVFKDGSLGFEVEKHHNVSSAYIYKKIGHGNCNAQKRKKKDRRRSIHYFVVYGFSVEKRR
jgi:hypothetical protein